jgi:predicted peptidase
MKLLLCIILSVSLLLPIGVYSQLTPTKQFIGKEPALVYQPSKLLAGKKYPLIIFLHGLSEVGDGTSTGLDILLKSGNQANLLTNADKYGYIVVAPQLVLALNAFKPEFSDTYIHPVLSWALANLPIDTTRIIVTGLSLGGGGTWDQATGMDAFRYAAAVPLCGTPQGELDYGAIARYHIAVWAFHALDDATIPPIATQSIMAFINAFNPVPAAKVTYYPKELGLGHAIWGTVYATDSLYTWMNAQHSGNIVPVPVPVKKVVFSLSISGITYTIYSDNTWQ